MVTEKLKEKEFAILKAARQRFAHYGYSKVTMDEIAADVEMGKASLYYYFPNKENLFQAVIFQEQDEFANEIEKMLKNETCAEDKLLQYVDLRLKYFHKLLNLGALSFYSFIEKKSQFKQYYQLFEERELLLLTKIFEEGKKKNEFKRNVDEKLIAVLLHILQGLRLRTLKSIQGQKIETKIYKELKEEMLTTVEIFLKGIKCSS
ncbi:MAG TPA: TetR/AcrR family transcriptional regulator [Ignavibacteriaceae bacterium]|nr:TetR/AcrR family transcriptional regulator [Ignavibacteriaceae bacterium]